MRNQLLSFLTILCLLVPFVSCQKVPQPDDCQFSKIVENNGKDLLFRPAIYNNGVVIHKEDKDDETILVVIPLPIEVEKITPNMVVLVSIPKDEASDIWLSDIIAVKGKLKENGDPYLVDASWITCTGTITVEDDNFDAITEAMNDNDFNVTIGYYVYHWWGELIGLH